jgi:hypothetical protein
MATTVNVNHHGIFPSIKVVSGTWYVVPIFPRLDALFLPSRSAKAALGQIFAINTVETCAHARSLILGGWMSKAYAFHRMRPVRSLPGLHKQLELSKATAR